tara:strand:- start:2203 stop:2463 length:261 start_codon:yes stop_codon:yes gene_type:complete
LAAPAKIEAAGILFLALWAHPGCFRLWVDKLSLDYLAGAQIVFVADQPEFLEYVVDAQIRAARRGVFVFEDGFNVITLQNILGGMH